MFTPFLDIMKLISQSGLDMIEVIENHGKAAKQCVNALNVTSVYPKREEILGTINHVCGRKI